MVMLSTDFIALIVFLLLSSWLSVLLKKLERRFPPELKQIHLSEKDAADNANPLAFDGEEHLFFALRGGRMIFIILITSLIMWKSLRMMSYNTGTSMLIGATTALLLIGLFNIIVSTVVVAFTDKKLSYLSHLLCRSLWWLFYPFNIIIHGLLKTKETTVTEEEQHRESVEFEEEMRSLLDEGEKKGIFKEEESALFQSLVEFKETVVREVMTPRLDFVAIEERASLTDLIHKIIDNGFTRIPVFKDRIDNIVGIVYAKDLLGHWGKADGDIGITDLLREAHFVPETKKVTQMLKEFQQKKNHMAIVVDEYGGISGLVTIEDLLEEIVGEIRDEYDNEEDEMRILEDGSVVADARMSVEDLEDHFHISLPHEDFDTLGGLVFHLLGRVPLEGEVIPYQNLLLEVLEAEERRVRKLHIKKITDKEREEFRIDK